MKKAGMNDFGLRVVICLALLLLGCVVFVSAVNLSSTNFQIAAPTVSPGAANMSSANFLLGWIFEEISGLLNSSSFNAKLGFYNVAMSAVSCQDLTTANSIYTLTQNVTSTGTCFRILANNITLDCAGFAINFSTSGAGGAFGVYSVGNWTSVQNCRIDEGNYTAGGSYGIYFSYASNGTIFNNTAVAIGNLSNGISLFSAGNNTVSNNIGTSVTLYGLYIGSYSNSNNLSYNVGGSNTSVGIRVEASTNNSLVTNTGVSNSGAGISLFNNSAGNYNLLVNNTGVSNFSFGLLLNVTNASSIYLQRGIGYLTGGYGVYVAGGSINNLVWDCVNVSGISGDVAIIGNSLNNTFLNCSYNTSKESAGAGSGLVRAWYLTAGVSNTTGVLDNATVLGLNLSSVMVFNETTNLSGEIGRLNVAEYINNGTRNYATPHNISASKTGYTTNRTTVNFTNTLNTRLTFTLFEGVMSVTLLLPTNSNVTTNRTPTFSWNSTNPTSANLIYDVNITCYEAGSIVSAGSLFIPKESQGNVTSYKPQYLRCLSDYGQTYNWSVRAYDGISYSDWASPRNLSVQSLITTNLLVSSVIFGSLNISQSVNTSSGVALPLILSNEGNTELNVSVNFTDIWITKPNPSSYFQFKITNNSGMCFAPAISQISWSNASGGSVFAVNRFNFTSGYQLGCSNLSMDVRISVPVNEPAGNKSSVVTFLSSLGENKVS